MDTVVFTGPTISAADARQELDALYLPPVSQGDVYRATQHHPRAIGIVDGYFERIPSVWHKEILWAMSRGIHVFGSASMGALRAAELAPFGMEGVGAIFEAYRDGRLEDDDEVAVIHGPAEVGYRPGSEAMVNIRSTLAQAETDNVISPALREMLERLAKGLYYPQRSYPHLLDLAAEHGAPPEDLQRLRVWLTSHQANPKRDDAIAMLRVMRQRLMDGLEPKNVRFSFEHTVYWDHATRVMGRAIEGEPTPSEDLDLDAVLDELRLTGSYRSVRDGAMGRYLAVEEARRRGMHVGHEGLQEAADRLRRDLDLADPADAERWLAENELGRDQLTSFLEEEALLRWIRGELGHQTSAHLLGHLRSTGDLARLLARARDKRRVLGERGLQNPSLTDAGLTEPALFRWYFETFLGRPLPADIIAFTQRAGFRSRAAFRRASLREYCYSAHAKSAPEGLEMHTDGEVDDS